MTSQIRLAVLFLVLAYSMVFGPGQALGGRGGLAKAFWRKTPRFRLHRHHVQVPPASWTEPLGARAVQFARRLVGVPYRWAGDSPRTGFDCSGFVRFVYAHFGLRLPHSSYADFGLGVSVPRQSLRPGDLVFFDGVGHVGMYVGDGRFIHAPHSGTSVQVTSLNDPWYRTSYDGARRLWTRFAFQRVYARLPRFRLF
jgi:cell wall-associated NlpC family hydrolase